MCSKELLSTTNIGCNKWKYFPFVACGRQHSSALRRPGEPCLFCRAYIIKQSCIFEYGDIPEITALKDRDTGFHYWYAAYAGDLLSRVVKFFAYYTPDPFSEEAIWFRVLTENRDEFIDALYEIIYCFYFDEHSRGDKDDAQYIAYVNAVFSFYENSLEFKEPSNTWGLIYVAKALADGVYETGDEGDGEDEEE